MSSTDMTTVQQNVVSYVGICVLDKWVAWPPRGQPTILSEKVFAMVHAYLHRVEGDLGNAAYWYNRASRPVRQTECLQEEWKELAIHFLSSNG